MVAGILVVACAVAVANRDQESSRGDSRGKRGEITRTSASDSASSTAPAIRGADPTVEILLTELDGKPRFTLQCEKGWVASLPGGAEIARSAAGGLEPVVRSPRGTVLLGSFDTNSTEVLLAPAGEAPIAVGKLKYAGTLRVKAAESGLRVTNCVAMERYVASVVGSEMYASSTPSASLEAQAIAARTYARWSIERRGRVPLPDSQEAQAYFGITRETSATRSAALATAGRVLTYDRDLLPAFYHSTCGGRTIDGSYLLGGSAPPPLRGGACGFCEGGKLYRWNSVVSAEALAETAGDLKLGKRIAQLEPAGPNPDPWSSVKLTGDARASTMPMRAFRSALLRTGNAPSLPSPFVDSVQPHKSGVTISGRGFGHGVGLCQVGAAEMGRRGRTCAQILEHYYPSARVEPADAIPPVARSR